jgi:hypothetical protein
VGARRPTGSAQDFANAPPPDRPPRPVRKNRPRRGIHRLGANAKRVLRLRLTATKTSSSCGDAVVTASLGRPTPE